MPRYLDSGEQLKLVLNLGAFVYLAELWVVDLHQLVDSYSLALWIIELIPSELMVYHWEWDVRLAQGVFSLVGALLWILPYRLLPFLSPVKVIPYLWILSLGIIAFRLFMAGSYQGEIMMPVLDSFLVGSLASYLVPAALFHYYFRSKAPDAIVGAKEPSIWAAK